jgi:hypothetical protein
MPALITLAGSDRRILRLVPDIGSVPLDIEAWLTCSPLAQKVIPRQAVKLKVFVNKFAVEFNTS